MTAPLDATAYTRLPTAAGISSLATRQERLYMGPDHLLVTELSASDERYRRFYYRDIQAFVVQHNDSHIWLSVILGALVFLAVAGILTTLADSDLDSYFPILVIGGALLAPLLAALAVNFWRGPACRTFLRTPSGGVRLYGLGRVRVAERALDRLIPAIQEAQRDLPPLGSADSANGAAATVQPLPMNALPLHAGHQARPRSTSGWAHTALYVTTLLGVVVSVADIAAPNRSVALFGGPILIAYLAFLCIALLSQRRTTLDRRVRRLTVFSLLYTVVQVAAYALMAATLGVRAVRSGEPAHIVSTAVDIVVSSGIGLLGLAWLRAWRRADGHIARTPDGAPIAAPGAAGPAAPPAAYATDSVPANAGVEEPAE